MKKIYLFLHLFLVGSLWPGCLMAQVGKGGVPRSFLKVVPPVSVPTLEMPQVDVAALRQEDAERRKMGKEFDRRFGYTFEGSWNLQNLGVWQTMPNGDRIWQAHIHCPGAHSINLTFSQFDLPEGADLFLWGSQNQIGALTSENHQPDRKLGTGLIWGEDLFLEYYEPAGGNNHSRLEIGYITHGYKNPFSILEFGDSDFCEMNVNCPMGQNWQDEKRSVVRIISNGDHCTAVLVNNTAQDFKPYVLTADHCFNNNFSTWVYSFNWEAPTCVTPSQPIPENQTLTGSTLKARRAATDFCLLELNSRPPASYDVFYSGWNAENPPAERSTFIHHPAGDIKKISFDFQAPTTSGYGVNSQNDSTHWRVWNYELATTTEGGSSGCPMYDQNHRIVGQLHGGPASCTNISSDFYGRFSWSWNKGTTPATRLRDWLDPANTGLLVLDGNEPGCRRIRPQLPWVVSMNDFAFPLPSGWQIRNPDQDSTFRLISGGFSGTKAIRFAKSAQITGSTADTLVFPAMNVSRYRNLRLSFRQAYRRQLANSDTLRILASRDCGQSFVSLSTLTSGQLITQSETGNAGVWFPVDTLEWASRLAVLDSTWSKSTSLTFAVSFQTNPEAGAATLWLDDWRLQGDSVGLPPLASVRSNGRLGCPGQAISFFDNSEFGPTSWTWVFEGGVPNVSTEANPQVVYPAEGVYPVFLRVRNPEGVDSIRIQDFIQIRNTGQQTMPFLESFQQTAFPPDGYVLSNPEGNRTWVRNATVTAPGSPAGSLMFDNFSQPNQTGNKDLLLLPRIQTAGKSQLKVRLRYAYKFYQNFGGSISPDTLRIGFSTDCGQTLRTLWKKGGQVLATAGSGGTQFTPVATDWGSIGLNLDSLLAYPEVSLFLENTFGFGNRIFVDDIRIDTLDPCPQAPIAQISDDSVCIGQMLVMEMDSIPGVSYSWTGPGGFTANTRVATRTMANGTNGNYTARMERGGCISEGVSFPVRVFALPTLPVISQAGEVLSGPGGFARYYWLLNGDTLTETSNTLTAPESGSYVLIVVNAAGCSRASNPRNVTVSVSKPIRYSSNFSVYPNPASNQIFINHPERFEVVSVENALGQNIPIPKPEFTPNLGWQIDLGAIPNGVYGIRVLQQGRLKTCMFIKGK